MRGSGPEPTGVELRKLSVLFLCTGNSARSILAEHFLRRLAPERFDVFSAGANPAGRVHPLALAILAGQGIDASDARSKSFTEYRGRTFDVVITVCDAAKESCPVWPGQPVVAHWGSEDPASVEGTDAEKRRAFERVAREIHRRLEVFSSLPLEKLDRRRREEAVRNAGRAG